MNNEAAEALATLHELSTPEQPARLMSGLRAMARKGITRRGDVWTWSGSHADAEQAPHGFPNLTEWEAAHNLMPLEGFIRLHSRALFGSAIVSEADQRLLLRHGFAFAFEFARFVRSLDPPVSIRAILSASADGVIFRFHEIRPGEQWDPTGPWAYRPHKMVKIDIKPMMP